MHGRVIADANHAFRRQLRMSSSFATSGIGIQISSDEHHARR